jgi:hypothetical protein
MRLTPTCSIQTPWLRRSTQLTTTRPRAPPFRPLCRHHNLCPTITKCTLTVLVWTFVDLTVAPHTGHTDPRTYPPRCNHNSSSTRAAQTRCLVQSQAPAHLYHFRHPRLVIQITLIRIRYFITISLCDNNMRCKCNDKRTCSLLARIRTARTKKGVPSQTAPCPTQNTRQWTMAAWTSPLVSSGKPTYQTSSTLCKRDIRRAHHGRQSLLERLKWYPHRKITGVQGVALVERMAQRPLLATYAIVETTLVVRRYPALAQRPMQQAWRIKECTAGRSPRQTHLQSRALAQQHRRGLRAPVVPSRAKVVHPQHARIASPKPRPCGVATPKATHFAMRVAFS